MGTTSTVSFLIGTLPRMVSAIVLELRRALLVFTSASASLSTTLITYIEKEENRESVACIVTKSEKKKKKTLLLKVPKAY